MIDPSYTLSHHTGPDCMTSAVTNIQFQVTPFSITMSWAPVITYPVGICASWYEVKYSYGTSSSEVPTLATTIEIGGLEPGTVVHFAVRAIPGCQLVFAGEWTFAKTSTDPAMPM